MRKLPKRPRSHQIASEATSYVRENLPKEWNTLEFPVQNDYGIDFFVEVFEDQVPTGTVFVIQCKSTLNRNSSESRALTYSWPVTNIAYLLDKKLRSLLVLYVTAERTAYWLWLNKWLMDKLDSRRPNWRKQQTISLEFPPQNILSAAIISHSVSSEYYPHELNVEETVFTLCGFYKDVIIVLIDIAENEGCREIADYTHKMEELNELFRTGVVNIGVREISGYWGFERWALRPELTGKGRKVMDFVNTYRKLVTQLGERYRAEWATAG